MADEQASKKNFNDWLESALKKYSEKIVMMDVFPVVLEVVT